MTKEDIKLICEADERMQWWAMILFAELSQYFDSVNHLANYKPGPNDHRMMFDQLKYKFEEFQKLIIQRQIEKAKDQIKEEQESPKFPIPQSS